MNKIETVYDVSTKNIIKLSSYAERYETIESAKNYDNFNSVFVNIYFGTASEDDILFFEKYEEMNDYYRMLLGLPEYDSSDRDYFYLSEEDVSDILLDIDISIPVHLQPTEIKSLLRKTGIIDTIYENTDGSDKYKYLKFVGMNMNPVTLRMSENFTIVYSDSDFLDSNARNIMDIFNEYYELARSYYMCGSFDEYYHDFFEFYDDLAARIILFSAVGLTIAYLSGGAIDVDSMLPDELMNVMFGFGLPEWRMPVSILRNMVRSLTILINSKGSKSCIFEIMGIFKFKKLYRYYIHKSIRSREFPRGTSEEDKYFLTIFKVPFGDKNVQKYLINEDMHVDFQEFMKNNTYDDRLIDEIKDQLYSSSFSLIPTNFMSIENIREISKFSFDISMFYQTFINSDLMKYTMMDLNTFGDKFSIFDILIYILVLSIKMNGYVDEIFYDVDRIIHVVGLDTKTKLDSFLHEFHTAFNISLNRNNSTVKKIESYSDLDSFTNLYDFLIGFTNDVNFIDDLRSMIDEETDYRRYSILKKMLDALTICEVNSSVYGNKETYTEFLASRSVKMYSRIIDLEERGNIDEMRSEMFGVLNALEVFLNQWNNSYIGDGISAISSIMSLELDYLKDFFYNAINFFKSHTNRFENLSEIYKISDEYNNVQILDMVESYMNLMEYDVGSYDRFKTVSDELKEVGSTVPKSIEIPDEIFLEDVLVEFKEKRKGGYISYGK